MQSISDNHYFISKENATLMSNFFLPFARENLQFFGPDVTSNFRVGLEKKLSQALGIPLGPKRSTTPKEMAFLIKFSEFWPIRIGPERAEMDHAQGH